MACSPKCPTQDCPSYGACLRRKAIQIDKHSLATSSNYEKRKDHTLSRFRECVYAGVTPQSPLKTDVEKAEKVLNGSPG